MTTAERFWAKVDRQGERGCWLWTAAHDQKGYGLFRADGRTVVRAHRYAYELLIGPIAQGLQLDHLCRVHGCVNPAHLEPVTPKENSHRSPVIVWKLAAAATTCKRGHPFEEQNTMSHHGRRACRECARLNRKVRDLSNIAYGLCEV